MHASLLSKRLDPIRSSSTNSTNRHPATIEVAHSPHPSLDALIRQSQLTRRVRTLLTVLADQIANLPASPKIADALAVCESAEEAARAAEAAAEHFQDDAEHFQDDARKQS